MNLGVQYYRPPFPQPKYWKDDFARIKDSGLNTVQLWVIWAWVESTPGRFVLDDYDQLVELAESNGLGVILSTIAEVQPYWIHREVPGSEMIDHMGRTVVSSNRNECHFGITPGGCTDHPDVWGRMRRFLEEVATRYQPAPHLRGWDAWNELRWNVQADGLVCFCPHTLAAFRQWLSDTYGGLDGLNEAWLRRYGSLEEVWPGKWHERPYTEMMAFEHFLTWRANQHGKARYQVIKAIDPDRAVTVHAAAPSALTAGHPEDQPINRGNDWFFADDLDGVGCSSFPKWQGIDDAEFGARVEFVRSASRGKAVWLSEVQGGRSAVGFNVFQRVDACSQQRWIYNGIACGADTILFWCWRDEVFGRESAGFGLVGNDGLADERLAAMRITGQLVEQHRPLLDAYRPSQPDVGVLFSPQTYYLTWAQEGSATRAARALRGYCRALIRRSIPYLVVEEEHLDVLSDLKVLFMPRTIVTSEATQQRLAAFVNAGGMLVCESECGAFSPQGIYRYPEDRFVAELTGIRELGRRDLQPDTMEVAIDSSRFRLQLSQWITPMQVAGDGIFAGHADGALVAEAPVGKGRVILCGSYLADAYLEDEYPDFEGFVELLACRAGHQPQIEVISPQPEHDAFVYTRTGTADGKRVIFVFFPPEHDTVQLRIAPGFLAGHTCTELLTGSNVSLTDEFAGRTCTLDQASCRLAVLVEQ